MSASGFFFILIWCILREFSILSVACGINHTVMITKSGEVYSCGNNDYGQLGHSKNRTKPGDFRIEFLKSTKTWMILLAARKFSGILVVVGLFAPGCWFSSTCTKANPGLFVGRVAGLFTFSYLTITELSLSVASCLFRACLYGRSFFPVYASCIFDC